MEQFLESFSIGAVLAAVAAAACYRTVALQSRGRSLRIWQLAIAPTLALLAGVTMLYRASLATPCLSAWLLVLIGGATVGAVSARSIALQVDHVWRVIRFNWGMDGTLAALVILIGAGSAAVFGFFSLSPLVYGCTAAIAAGFCAGLLGGRAWTIRKRVLYAADTTLVGQ